MSCYKIGCKLFNIIFMILHDRMKKNECGYGFVDSTSLACKIWALESDWETLLICNPDHRNSKQVFKCNDIIAQNTKHKDDVLCK